MPKKTLYADFSKDPHKNIFFLLDKLGLKDSYQEQAEPEKNVRKPGNLSAINVSYNLPANIDWDKLLSDISKYMIANNLRVDIQEFESAPPANIAKIKISKESMALLNITLIQKVLGKIAIVIDDVGNNSKALYPATQIERPMTYAVLPFCLKSYKLSELLYNRGDFIILHQPMASIEKLNLGAGAILPEMKEKDIIGTLDKNLADIGYAKGLNNHMGSLVTKDKRIMRIVMKYLKNKGMLFLDSCTSKNVTKEIASELGVVYYQRDVFLDNKHDKDYIKGQIDKLCKVALRRGYAIGIGHFYPITLECVNEKIGYIDKQHIKMVYLNKIPEKKL